MALYYIKLTSIVFIFAVTIIAGSYPFLKKIRSKKKFEFPIGESLAAGVFLGAGLIHMLGDSVQGFAAAGYSYPFPFLLAGLAFLLLLFFEHLAREFHEHDATSSPSFAILAVVMLSIHSFLTGAALGLSLSWSVFAVILIAVLAHKWAASFALAVEINKSSLPPKFGIFLFLIFAIMVPLGIIFGDIITNSMFHNSLLAPIFTSLAAGTFLYFGTLHGLKNSVLVEKCCDLKQFNFVIIGFLIMALVAIWT